MNVMAVICGLPGAARFAALLGGGQRSLGMGDQLHGRAGTSGPLLSWHLDRGLPTALLFAGLTTDAPMPMIAVWRIVCTVLGVLVEALAVVLVFPVSAKQVRGVCLLAVAAVAAKAMEAAAVVAVPRPTTHLLRETRSLLLAAHQPLALSKAGVC